jgi:hypothetical protein
MTDFATILLILLCFSRKWKNGSFGKSMDFFIEESRDVG